jgi:simple sugar transport system ATP-binding protein
VHRRLVQERDEGRAILLVSFALDEILSLSDRILVLYAGKIVAELPATATKDEVGLAMAGGSPRIEGEWRDGTRTDPRRNGRLAVGPRRD